MHNLVIWLPNENYMRICGILIFHQYQFFSRDYISFPRRTNLSTKIFFSLYAFSTIIHMKTNEPSLKLIQKQSYLSLRCFLLNLRVFWKTEIEKFCGMHVYIFSFLCDLQDCLTEGSNESNEWWIYAKNVYWNHSYYTYMMWHHILDTQNPVRIQEIFPVSTITFF